MGCRVTFTSAIRWGAVVLGAGFGIAPVNAQASGRNSQTMQVALEVTHACRLSTNTLDFGVPLKNANTVSATTTMSVECTPGTLFSIAIDQGQNWDGLTRRMRNDEAPAKREYATYQIFRDPLHLLPWGTGLSSVVTTTPVTGNRTLVVYGLADVRKLKKGPYVDTVTVVLDF